MAEPLNPLLRRKAILGMVAESSLGTDTTSSVTAAIPGTSIFNASLVPFDVMSEGERRPNGHYLGNTDFVPGRTAARLTFSQYLISGNITNTIFLPGCGVVNATGYKPTSNMASRKTNSAKLWQDGRVLSAFGLMGNMTFNFTVGAPVMIEHDWIGIFKAPADASMPAQSPINTQPYVAKSMTVTIGGATVPRVTSLSFTLGNNTELINSLTASSGIAYANISERSPRVTMDTEARKVADLDQLGLYTAGTTVAMVISVSNGTTTYQISIPRAQRVEVGAGARTGILIDDMTFACIASSGDDEFSITEA